MKRFRIIRLTFLLAIAVFIVGCAIPEVEDQSNNEQKQTGIQQKQVISKNIQLTKYAKEIGFSLTTPTKEKLEAKTKIDIKGEMEQSIGVDWVHLWVVITPKDGIDELENDAFNYYIPVENGAFSKQIFLHHGAGEYEISVRAPSNKGSEEGMYYDVATFTAVNEDHEIKREVEYTLYGAQHGIQLSRPQIGMEASDGIVFIEGIVPKDHAGDMVIVQVGKDSESQQVVLPIHNHSFSGEVPLYFGEGLHTIDIQTYNKEKDLYYQSASLYAENQSAKEFAEMVKYTDYISRGISLYEPSVKQEVNQFKQEYRIAGEVDASIPGADDITHMIVSVNNVDEDVSSRYLIPVENYQFDGLAYFRFGPGNYEVIVSIPDTDKKDRTKLYYQGVAKINHHVLDIPDERGLLPSGGIQSDHPAIIEQAKQLTANLTSEREKAKAIYKFVAQHVSYDVKKAEESLFTIGDSALATLESGNGVCQDYAFLATGLLRAIGMESHYVEGDAGERHAWVEVKVDGEWLVMDPTWGAGYIQDGVFHFHYNEDYFDPDPAFLAETHTREGIVY